MQAKAEGLWNLWLPGPLAASVQHLKEACPDEVDRAVLLGAGLSNLEYASVCEPMGRCGRLNMGNIHPLPLPVITLAHS